MDEKEKQIKAWERLIALYEELLDINNDIMDFAVEEAIETIIEACDNYVSAKHGG